MMWEVCGVIDDVQGVYVELETDNFILNLATNPWDNTSEWDDYWVSLISNSSYSNEDKDHNTYELPKNWTPA